MGPAQPRLSPIIINEVSLRAAKLFICKIGLYGATGKEDSLKNKSQRESYRGRERGLTSIPDQNGSSPQARIQLSTGGFRRPLVLNSLGDLSDPPPHPKVVLSARENLPLSLRGGKMAGQHLSSLAASASADTELLFFPLPALVSPVRSRRDPWVD